MPQLVSGRLARGNTDTHPEDDQRAIVNKLILLFGIVQVAFLFTANAQTERPAPNSQQPQGIQITNLPPDDKRSPETEQDHHATEQDRRATQQDHRVTDQQQENMQRVVQSTPRAPEPDIEFQEFVASSLGYRLPIFGQDLFRNPPSTFAPVDHIAVAPDYLIGPGDELLIRAWGQIDINYRTNVDRTGAIYIPKIGSVTVAGLRYDQLQGTIHEAIGRVFKNFDLAVTLGQLRSIQVFMIGQVRRPGVYTVSSLSTLVNALFASGGPSKRGSMRRIELKRSGHVVTTFDFYDLLTNGDKSKDKPLLPGDVIYVPPVGHLVALAGSVNVPAIFELQEHENLGDVIRYAGGITTTAAAEKAVIERIDDHHVRRADEFKLSADGLRRDLQDGDIVRFLHISSKFENAVTLRGNVALPGRYPFRSGMRIHDLIPNREFLITDEYWKRQNELGRKDDNGFLLPEERERLQIESSGPSLDKATSSPTQLPDAISKSDAQRLKQQELKNQIKRSGAEINWEYAVIQRISPNDLTTNLLPFNLGKAIEGEPDQNLTLQAGDVITVFSQKDMQVPIAQQTKFVRLEGEFRSAGLYEAQPGETLRGMIGRVGGFTSQAYLYGAEFTRESTREAQQKRLDEYITDLEQQVERYAAPTGAPSVEEIAADKQRVEGQRRLLEKMRQLRSNGRVVLEIRPDADSIEAFPDLVLEDGDRLFVPFRPATVNILGAVYTSNSFVFKPGKTVDDYLGLAGGPTRSGDAKKEFVVLANGQTVSRQSTGSWLGRSFGNIRLMPGDTVIVPEKVQPGTGLRNFKDWTQVIAQLGITAATTAILIP